MRKKEVGRLRQKCFALGKALVFSERDFSFSLKIGEVFAMSLVASDCKTIPKSRRRTPSYRRRQERRRAFFLEKKNTPGVNLGGIAETTMKNIQDREGCGETVEQTLEEDQSQGAQKVTLRDISDRADEIIDLLSMSRNESAAVPGEPAADRLQRSHGDLGTTDLANLQETNNVVSGEEEEQESADENDLMDRFSSLGRSMKTFQRDLSSADQKVESARKMSSPLKKKRRRRR